ncbi:MAG: hypothetical protein ACYCS8_02085 [Acidithiobacillus sp.]
MITHPLKVMLFTNRPESVDRMRQTLAAHPAAAAWWSVLFAAVLSFTAIPLQHLLQPKSPPIIFGWVSLVSSVFILLVAILGILFMNGMATWAVNRQQRKPWGVPLPDEPRILGFRPGIWMGMATSYAIAIIMITLEVCVILLPSPASFHTLVTNTMGTVISAMSLLWFSYAISYFYGIPKRLFVFRYVVLPVVLMSIIGIVVAVVMGQARKHESQKVRPEAYHSAAPATMTAPTHLPSARLPSARLPAPSPVVPQPGTGVYAARLPAHMTVHAPLTPPRFGGPLTLSSMIRKDDAHCLAGLPLAAPWSSAPPVSATVVRFVPRMEVLRDMVWNNRTLHGMIAPRYLRNQRVLLHPDGSHADVIMLALVPTGMRVTIGERVRMDSFHASHRMPCTYVPNLIER